MDGEENKEKQEIVALLCLWPNPHARFLHFVCLFVLNMLCAHKPCFACCLPVSFQSLVRFNKVGPRFMPVYVGLREPHRFNQVYVSYKNMTK